MNQFQDRYDAANQLVLALSKYNNASNAIVLALAHGGVPIGLEIARNLNLPLDVLLVRKLYTSNGKGISFGAVAQDGICIFNNELIIANNLETDLVDSLIDKAEREIVRLDRLYRRKRPYLNLKGKTVILADEGAITGASIHAAIENAKRYDALKIIVVLPIASQIVCDELKEIVDEVICLYTPEDVSSLSEYYEDFAPVTDSEIQNYLDYAPLEVSAANV